MARLTTAILLLIGSVGLPSFGAAQVLTFAKNDYASDVGARGVASADFNRDGWVDLAHANGTRNTVTILLSRGGASLARAFEIPIGAGPFALTTGDLNRDGIPDLAVTNADGDSISILLGRGDGSFTRTDIAAPSQNPRGITIADVNHDGRPDLIYTGYATGIVQVLLGNGAGGFTKGASVTAAGTHPQGIATGDFNHDGKLDVAVAVDSGNRLRILFGTSAGSFTARTIAGHGNLNVLAVGDLNGDGWLDVAAASTSRSDVSVYLGSASGLSFTRSYEVGLSPRGIALGDANDDGRLDIVTANRSSSTVSILLGDRARPGTFLAPEEIDAARGSRTVTLEDFDRDGRLDVATGNESTAAVTVLSNVTPFKPAGFSFNALALPANLLTQKTIGSRFSNAVPHLAVGDFNRDGRTDFVAPGDPTAGSAGVVVMLRDGPAVTLAGPEPLAGFLVDDFNGDGNADVLIYSTDPAASELTTQFLTYLGDGRGHFTPSPTTVQPQSLAFCASGDLNRDGRPDLACDGAVLLGNGNGTFRRGVASVESGGGPPGPLLADVNRDGKLDVVIGAGVFQGDGAGGLVLADSFAGRDFQGDRLLAVADLNRDGYVDLIFEFGPTDVGLVYGSADGFVRFDLQSTLEGFVGIAVADVNVDGNPDIVLNGSSDPEGAGILEVLFGDGDGTFSPKFFALTLGAIAVGDVTGDGLPDVAAYDADGVHVLVNERNDTNHPPVVPDYSVAPGYPCVTLDANASDPDQHALTVEWFDSSGASIRTGIGAFSGLDVCVTQPGTYKYRRTATDGRGGTASGTVTFIYQVTLKEIVLYAAAGNVQMAGNWSRIADPTAAGGFRAHDRNVGAPKVVQPSETPANTVTIPFLADPNLTYKLWVRLKADDNFWANDSVWVQLSGAFSVPFGVDVYRPGTTSGLPVNLEECRNCGVSEWGWEDDGWGVVNKNGVLLRFEPGPQMIVIQTREDGVSIDQIVLSAEKYLTTRPGLAKNDRTILPATAPR
jgi:hypothetical protein